MKLRRLNKVIVGSNCLVLFVEPFDALLVSHIGYIWVPFEGRSSKEFLSGTKLVHEFLVLHVTVTQSWQFTSLPREMTDVKTVMEWAEEQDAICDEHEFVGVAELHWVHSTHHFF